MRHLRLGRVRELRGSRALRNFVWAEKNWGVEGKWVSVEILGVLR